MNIHARITFWYNFNHIRAQLFGIWAFTCSKTPDFAHFSTLVFKLEVIIIKPLNIMNKIKTHIISCETCM